jgi:radical SAM superfamily enzyme YgiQ (UPF0313 family)
MAKIFVANPPFRQGVRSARWPYSLRVKNTYFLYPPWFLMYSTSLIEKEGMDVSLLDAVALDIDNKQFIRKTSKENPELLIAETAALTLKNDLENMKEIKEKIGCKIALAGPHVTVLAKEVLKNDFIDFVFVGEYELTALELSKKFNSPKTYKKILGLAFKNKGKIIINSRRPLLDVDKLPLPARHFLPMERYNEGSGAEVPNQQLLSSRGCPFQCIFCSWPQTLYNRKVRFRSSKPVIDEMEMLIEKYKPKELYFDDDSFSISNNHILGIVNEMEKRDLKFPWSCMCHAKIPQDVLEKMVKNGLVGVKFGIESASQEVLKKNKKNLDLDEVVNFVKRCKKLGLRTFATFMVGLYGDTKETMEKTLEMAATIDVDNFQTAIATPYPGTEFYDICKKNNWLVTNDFSRYDGNKESVVSYPWLSKQEIDKTFQRSKDLITKFDPKRLLVYPKVVYERDGLGGVAKLLVKQGPKFGAGLIRKKLFQIIEKNS